MWTARKGNTSGSPRHGRRARLIGAAGERPRVVLAVRDDLRAARRAFRTGVDIVELRIDQFARHDSAHVQQVVRRTVAAFDCPLLATIRSVAEGGGAQLDDLTRAQLWELVSPDVAAIDVEIRCARGLRETLDRAHNGGLLVVLSYHDFQGTPELRQLAATLRNARRLGADVVKFATYARNPEEFWRLAAFTWANRTIPIVTMAMGPFGPLSRLVLPLLGSRWVYTSVTPVHGQIPLARLLADLDFYFP